MASKVLVSVLIMSLFSSAMPFDSAVYLMDCFFYDGAKVMFQLALTILQENKQQLLECTDEGDSISLLAKYLEMIDNPDRKIEVGPVVWGLGFGNSL